MPPSDVESLNYRHLRTHQHALGLTETQLDLVERLCLPETGQAHIFDAWCRLDDDEAAVSVSAIQNAASLLLELDRGYPAGGLVGYVQNARKLLADSRAGVNPLAGWFPTVPTGERFDNTPPPSPEYLVVEQAGLATLCAPGGGIGFVLVAGGLGERLGYGGIKIGLPTELSTGTSYLQLYIRYIVALQNRVAAAAGGRRASPVSFPLCIMTSGDTNAKTLELLQANNYFVADGFTKEQFTIVQQGKGVPALVDNDAHFEMDPQDPYRIVTKPHGHGDIHSLLYSHGVARAWCEKGLKYLVLFQDTNGLAFPTLPLMVGVSEKYNLIMNSLAVPRKAKQAIGGIARLKHEISGAYRTINVEYNQLDPLLRATGHHEGDVNEEDTGFSPFPGNINQLLFRLTPYCAALERTQGLMPEFVNPKYADATKTKFKKPARLECMMQDFPTVLEGEEAQRAGFTSVTADLCFSPVKNATADGVELQKNGTQAGTAATGEADQYAACRILMRAIGCQVTDAPKETYAGISVVPGPAIVLSPDFVMCPGDYAIKFPTPSLVKISSRSTLIVEKGTNVIIESLELDGALVITGDKDPILVKNVLVKNDGWVRESIDVNDTSINETLRMRGYRIVKKDTDYIGKQGTYHGYTKQKEHDPDKKECFVFCTVL